MPVPCPSQPVGPDGGCGSHLPGHRMPRLLAELVRRSPWGWRRGRVLSVSPDGWMLLDCSDDDAAAAGGTGALTGRGSLVHAWHHADLAGQLLPGTPVRLHQRGGRHDEAPLGLGPAALAGLPGHPGLVSLHVAQGPPPLPEPQGLDAWAHDDDAVVIDLRTRELLVPSRADGTWRD